MVSIGMGSHLKDILVQFVHNHEDLVVEVHVVLSHDLNEGLDHSGSMIVHTDFDQGWNDGVDNFLNVVD